MAIYVGVLKWLGWLVLTRRSSLVPTFVIWPAELFAGLAALVCWFYLRNLLGWLWPGSYSLAELQLLPLLAVVLHLFALASKFRLQLVGVDWRRDLGQRVAMYSPFVLALVVAVWLVSGTMGVQAVDPVLHAFQAKVYMHEGLFFPVGPLQTPLRYPSGFAAVNAVTAAVSTLTPVQAVNLQHILWIIVGLFLVTGTLTALAGRRLPLLHWTVLTFLVLFPIYGLFPDYGYSGTPRQMAPPLFLAIALLPAVAPVETNRGRLVVFGISAVLAVLTLLLNPICAPFTLAVLIVATLIHWFRWAKTTRPRLAAIGIQVLAFALAATLFAACDRHFAGYFARHTAASAPEPESAPRVPSLRFSLSSAFRDVLAVNPLDLTPTVILGEYPRDPEELAWTERWPQHLVPWLAGMLSLLAIGLMGLPRDWQRVPGAGPVMLLLIGCLAAWLLFKIGIAIAVGSVASTAWRGTLLQVYLMTMLTRVELVLLFAMLAAAGTLLHLYLRQHAIHGRLYRRLAPAGVAGFAILTLGLVAGNYMRSGYYIMPVGNSYTISADDRKLVAWMDENLPPARGRIGLAAIAFTRGPEKHLYAMYGSQAVVQYGRHYNFRFGMRSLEKDQGFDDYVANIYKSFNAPWCSEHDIHFFYVDQRSLEFNPGLARAISEGKLKLLLQEGTSAIYEVVREAAT
jgi:hypothetical protein